MSTRALIADDEEPLAHYLADRLSILWPDLAIIGFAANGKDALAMINAEKPDIAFLDIQMPGLTGIEVAKNMTHPALVVFVTAFDEYAVQCFEEEAIDYILKPVSDERLTRSIRRIRKRLEESHHQADLDGLLEKLGRAMMKKDPYISLLRAESGRDIRLLPVDTILFIQSRTRYTAVVTKEGEFLTRTPINVLLKRLDPERFWQVHRSTIVNVNKILSIKKTDQQRYTLRLIDSAEQLTVSRQFTHLFSQAEMP
jgi:DNA-binding LytR/AlgR family response regulator